MPAALDVPPVGWDGRGPRCEDHDLYSQQRKEAAHGVGVGLPRGHAERGEQDHRVVEPGINPDPPGVKVDHLVEARLEVSRGRPCSTLSPEIKLIPTDNQDERDDKLKYSVEQDYQNILAREPRWEVVHKSRGCSAPPGSPPTPSRLRASAPFRAVVARFPNKPRQLPSGWMTRQ